MNTIDSYTVILSKPLIDLGSMIHLSHLDNFYSVGSFAKPDWLSMFGSLNFS